jgi:heme A synthase
LLPPLGRFTGYAPLWLNLTFNQYAIQLLHRLAAVVTWVAFLGVTIAMWRRRAPAFKAVGVLFMVVTAEMATGIASLVLGVPAVPAVVHEVGAVFVLAGVFFCCWRVGPFVKCRGLVGKSAKYASNRRRKREAAPQLRLMPV